MNPANKERGEIIGEEPAHALYECDVFHRRITPRKHEFLYRIFLFCIDLDRLQTLGGMFPFLGVQRSALYSFHSSDHFGKEGNQPLRPKICNWLRERGVESPDRIVFLTNLRFFGYVFNPIAIYYCFRKDGTPLAAITQVGNTFGEQKLYLIPPVGSPVSFQARQRKNFYVSPFSELNLDFDFRIFPPGDTLRVFIDEYRGEEKTLTSTLTGKRQSLSVKNLLWITAKYPFITLRVIFLIHWQAFRLWAGKFPHHRKEENPDLQTDVLARRKGEGL